MRYWITLILCLAAMGAWAATTFVSNETLTATKLNTAIAEQRSDEAFNAYSTVQGRYRAGYRNFSTNISSNKLDVARYAAYSSGGRFNGLRFQSYSTHWNPGTWNTIYQTLAKQSAYSTSRQAEINSKVTTGSAAVFSSISTTSSTRYVNVGNSDAAGSVPRTNGTIFGTMTSMYYVEGTTAKRMGSGTGTTDISGKLDTAVFNTYTSTSRATKSYVDAQVAGVSSGTLPHFSNYTGADGATWIDKGSTPPSLVTRIADKLYSVAMSLKATLYALLGWSSASHDFGNVTSGSFSNYSTTLSNTGAYATVSLAFSNLSTGVFRTYSTPTSIAAGSSAKIKYQFTPSDTNAHTGHLHATGTGITAAVLTLTGTGTASETLLTEYNISNRDNGVVVGNSGTSYLYVSQGFKVSSNKTLSKVSIPLKRTGTLAGNIEVYIYSSTGSTPETFVAGPVTLAASSVGTIDYAMTDFSISASLTSGTQYHIVMTSPYTDSSNRMLWGSDGSSPSYADGAAYHSNTIDSGYTSHGMDMIFGVYGQ